MDAARVLAVDLGEARIGLAVSDPLGLTAQPLDPLASVGPRKDLAAIERIAREWEARTIVIGWPRSLDGSSGEKAQAAEAVAEELRRRNPRWRIELWDERLTTVEAERAMRDTGMKKRRKRQRVDGIAASLILQGFLEAAPPSMDLSPDDPSG